MTLLVAICGAGIALGVLLVIAGWRGLRFSAPKAVVGRLQGLSLRIVASALVGLVLLGVTGWLIAGILGAGFVFFARQLLGGNKAQLREIERTEAVASWAEMLRDTMAGAAGIEGAIAASAQSAPVPIRSEVRALARRLERQALEPALRQFATDVNHPTADLVASALGLAANKSARRLGELLGSLATAARADATMRLRIDAGRARTRTSVRVVVGVTAAMALGLLVLNRDYLEPYGTAFGQLMLLGVGTCFGTAFWWMNRMGAVNQRHPQPVGAS